MEPIEITVAACAGVVLCGAGLIRYRFKRGQPLIAEESYDE
jgi:hypothetical protein